MSKRTSLHDTMAGRVRETTPKLSLAALIEVEVEHDTNCISLQVSHDRNSSGCGTTLSKAKLLNLENESPHIVPEAATFVREICLACLRGWSLLSKLRKRAKFLGLVLLRSTDGRAKGA